jgi:trk system potassium uptake protein TrkH
MVLGTICMTAANIYEGIGLVPALFQGLWVFMGAWSTGGFAPYSYNVLYYHSLIIETLTMVFFIIGSFNFALHWAVWTGNRREIYRNIEIVSFMTTLFIAVSLGTYALMRIEALQGTASFFRVAFFQLVSGHTTTGMMTMYPRQFVVQWDTLSMLAVIIAMALGASAASTAGGIKGMRVGIIFKSFTSEIRRLMAPDSAVLVNKIHHIKDRYIDDHQIRAAMMIAISFILIYMGGALLGAFYDYPLTEALFESVSAGSNSGLSCGITAPSMPTALKLFYIVIMWLGRLEFVAAFAMIGFFVRVARGR